MVSRVTDNVALVLQQISIKIFVNVHIHSHNQGYDLHCNKHEKHGSYEKPFSGVMNKLSRPITAVCSALMHISNLDACVVLVNPWSYSSMVNPNILLVKRTVTCTRYGSNNFSFWLPNHSSLNNINVPHNQLVS